MLSSLANHYDPMVSVIIPTYRRWDMLCNAIESVMKQTFSNWEIIVVNDCGGEPTKEALNLLSDPRVKYLIHEQNMGLASARNTGLSASKAKYIAYLDDDDIYYENHLAVLVSALEENKWDIAYTLANKAFYKLVGASYEPVNKKIAYNRPFKLKSLWRSNFIPVNCIMHLRDCILTTGNFDSSLPLLEDWDLWLRMSLKFNFHSISAVTCEVSVRAGKSNMSTMASDDKWQRVKATIFSKYLDQKDILDNVVFRKFLFNGISQFVRKNVDWFRAALTDKLMVRIVINLLECVFLRTWVRMIIKKPILSINLLITFLQTRRIHVLS